MWPHTTHPSEDIATIRQEVAFEKYRPTSTPDIETCLSNSEYQIVNKGIGSNVDQKVGDHAQQMPPHIRANRPAKQLTGISGCYVPNALDDIAKGAYHMREITAFP